VFAYGQTGSGKTFTMEGGDEDNEEQVLTRLMCEAASIFSHLRVLF
jgi:hypothetical protein